MRRHYRFVCWLLCLLTLANVVGAGSRSLPEEGRTLLTWCFVGVGMVWVDMSIILLCWSLVLWARGGLASSPAGRPEPPRRRGGGNLIERLCRQTGWVLTGREADRYQVRSGDHRPPIYIELRYSERAPNIVLQSFFPIRFSMEKPPSGLFARVLMRGTALSWASWGLSIGPNCDAALVVSAGLPRAGLSAALFRDVCEEIAGEIRGFRQELHDKFAWDLGGAAPEAMPWEKRSGVPARRHENLPGVWPGN
jgi:hypothetical protein